jgi:hypothetical protein
LVKLWELENKPRREEQKTIEPSWMFRSGITGTGRVDANTGEVLNESRTLEVGLQGGALPMEGGPLVSAPGSASQPWLQDIVQDPAVLLRKSVEAVAAARHALQKGHANNFFYKNEIAPKLAQLDKEIREIRRTFEAGENPDG